MDNGDLESAADNSATGDSGSTADINDTDGVPAEVGVWVDDLLAVDAHSETINGSPMEFDEHGQAGTPTGSDADAEGDNIFAIPYRMCGVESPFDGSIHCFVHKR